MKVRGGEGPITPGRLLGGLLLLIAVFLMIAFMGQWPVYASFWLGLLGITQVMGG